MGLASAIQAQPITAPAIDGLAPGDAVRAGAAFVEQGDARRALSLLRPVVQNDAGYVSRTEGAAAYWLGRAYEVQGRTDSAKAVWQRGTRAMMDGDAFDVRLADAYLRTLPVLLSARQRLLAAGAYARLVQQVGPGRPEAEDALLRMHVARLAPLLTDGELAHVIEQERDADVATWTFKPEAGAFLHTWWQRRDPLPATEENERLEEHVSRMVYAREAYACEDRASRWDDRGDVYLRFGTPYRTKEINFIDGNFIREVFRFGVPVTSHDFPENTFWSYRHVDQAGYYLFARERKSGDCFAIAEANDLIPSLLRQGRGTNERGLNIAVSALAAMEYVYRELALEHIDFGTRYQEIADYTSYQEMQATAARVGVPTSLGQSRVQVGAGVGQTRTVTTDRAFGVSPPNQFVQRMVSEGYRADRDAARRRKKAMPRAYSAIMADVDPLEVAVRTARFLKPNGTTRAEIYWGAASDAIRPEDMEGPRDTTLVAFAVVPYRADRTRGPLKRHDHLVVSTPEEGGFVMPTLDVDVKGDLSHVGMQWTQYEASVKDRQVQLGKQLRHTSARADTLRALSTAPGTLEMSDLKVLTTSERDVEAALAQSTPYPFHAIAAETPLLLYFEVYRLQFNADDETRYTVAYEVERKTKQGAWARLFRGEDTQRTTAQTTYEGTTRTATEYLMLDLNEWAAQRDGDLRIVVRVTDEVSGQTVQRPIDFELIATDDE